jgi:hypothetical protein
MATVIGSRTPSPTPSKLPPIPGSPSYSYASTANPLSSFHLPLPPPPTTPHAVLSKADLELSQTAYSELLTTAKTFRIALATLSTAASAFGSALESCARLKEARSEALHPQGSSLAGSFTAGAGSCTADSLMAASGVHQLIANHQQILSETVYRSFEVPLLHELDSWRRRMEEEEVTYQREVRIQSKEIRKMEKEGLKLHKQKKRDVSKFRNHLVELTTKLDGLTTLHGGHARSLLRDSQDVSVKIVESSSSLVRAEVDIFECLARKGWSGGGLDDLLEKGVDLFSSEPDTGHNESPKIFSILPNKSILADSAADPAGTRGHGRNDSLLADGNRYQSLTAAIAEDRDEDAGSIFSGKNVEGILNKSRGVRPFSPPPTNRFAALEMPEEDEASEVEGNDDKAKDDEEESLKTITEDSTADDDRGRERRWSVTDDGTMSD